MTDTNKCSECEHAHRVPDPNNITAKMYQCRESPPTATAFSTRGGMGFVTSYPQVSEDYAACSRFSQRLAVFNA